MYHQETLGIAIIKIKYEAILENGGDKKIWLSFYQTQKMAHFVRLVVSNLPIIVDTLYNCWTPMYNIQF